MKTALVTGANKGIGFEISRQLAARGFHVWLGCRDEERGSEAERALRRESLNANFLHLDVESEHSINEAVAKLARQAAHLDVLVNNAGMHFGPPPDSTLESIDQFEKMFRVNTLGPLRVTQAFLPLIKKAKSGRVIMATSGLGSIGGTLDMTHENWGVGFAGYCTSKSALNMITVKLAKDLAPLGIKVNAADPGLTATDLTGHHGDRTPKEAARCAVSLALIAEFGPTAGFFHIDASGKLAQHRW